VKADNFDTPTNPYHYVLHCIGGKWKMTILHEIYTYGSIRFNQTLKILPISEKVFSQQLKELVEAGGAHLPNGVLHQRGPRSHMKKIWSAYCFLNWHEQYFG